MPEVYSQKRKSGVSLVGDLPWGTHFCQFYQTEKDLLDILIPYFKAGLEGNELCLWVISRPLDVETARKALEAAVPNLEEYLNTAQLEIIPETQWHARGGTSDAGVPSELDRAMSGGFDGLRLSCGATRNKKDGAIFTCYGTDVVSSYNVIAAFTYPRDECDAIGLMEVVKNHRFALVRNLDTWEIIESSEARTVKDALKRTEEKLESLFSNMSEGFAYHRVILDATGKPCDYVFLQVNEAFERLTGLRAEKIVGRRVTDVIPGVERDPADWIGRYGRVAMTGKPVQFESYAEALQKWFSVSAFSPHRAYFAATFSDTTERKRMEEALRASEERYRTTIASIGDAVITTDAAGTVSFMNPVAEQLTGWTLPEAAKMPVGQIFSIVNEYTRAHVDCPVAKVLREGTIVGLANHTILIRKDGTELAVDDSGAPIRDKDGKIVGVVLVFRDITERRRAEEDLKRSMERLEIISDTASRLLMSNDPQEVINALCQRVMEHLDCQAFFNFLVDEERNCLRLNTYAGIPEETAREIQFLDYGVAVCGCAARDACRIVAENIPTTPDMRTDLVRSFGIQAYAAHPLFAQGRVIGTLSFGTKSRLTFTDDEINLMKTVADQVATAMERGRLYRAAEWRAEELERRVQERTAELQQAYDKLMRETREREQVEAQLRQAQKMDALGTLTGGIAHDFNNILAAIIGFTEIAKDKVPAESRVQHHLERVLEAGIRGRDLVKHMLTFSRQSEQEKKPLPLSSIVKETIKLLRASIPTTIGIRLNIRSESSFVFADPVQMQQVVMNLCANGAYAMREKGGTLDVELSDFSVARSNGNPQGIEPGLYMKLTVRDTGGGIAPEIMEKIFDPFFTTKKPGEGTGLGLAVVHGIVKQHSGYITVESEPGRGSLFAVFLPKATEKGPLEMTGEFAIPTGKEKVLFVDDEEALAEVGQELLEELGYSVTVKRSSIEALAAFRSNPGDYDLIITDQTMPEITGLELAGEVLTLRPDMPIILCTGFSHLIDAAGAAAAGIRAFLMKPLTKGELARTVRDVLDATCASSPPVDDDLP